MKNLLSILILLMMSAIMAFGQENDSFIDWGPKQEEHKGLHRIMTVTDDYVYVLHRGKDGLFVGNLQILKFDKNNETVESIKVSDVFDKHLLIIDIIPAKDSLNFLVFNYNKDKPKLEVHSYDSKTLDFLKKKKVLRLEPKVSIYDNVSVMHPTNINKMIWLDEMVYWTDKKNSIRFALSKDKSKIIFNQRTKKKKDSYDKITILDRKTYKVLNELKIKDDAKGETEIVNIRVDLNGQIIVLLKVDLNKAEKKKRKKGPDYDFELIKKAVDSTKVTVKIAVDKYYMSSSDLVIDEEGNTIILFMYGEDEDQPQGIANYMVNVNNELTYAKHHKSSILEKGKDHIDENFEIVHSFKTKERLVVMYRSIRKKFRKVGIRYLSFYNTHIGQPGHIVFKYEDMVFEIFDNENNLLASNTIQHHGKCNDTDDFLRYDISHDENSFWTITNIHAETYEKISVGESTSKTYPNSNNVITKIIFDYEGNYKLQTLSPEDNLVVSRESLVNYKGVNHFIGFGKKGKNVQLGIMESNK